MPDGAQPGENGHIGLNEPADVSERDTQEVTPTASTRQANARFLDDNPELTPTRAIGLGIGTIMRAKEDHTFLYGRGEGRYPVSLAVSEDRPEDTGVDIADTRGYYDCG